MKKPVPPTWTVLDRWSPGAVEELVEEIVAEGPVAAEAPAAGLLAAVGLDAHDGRAGLLGDGDEVQGRLLLGRGGGEEVRRRGRGLGRDEDARDGRFLVGGVRKE